MAKKKPGFAFEQSLAELEALVEKMESGELSLEQSLQAFEQGVSLTRDCQQALTSAQQKVELLVEKEQRLTNEPFIPADSE
ncbi:exodeoxyribonuclease VII small subunit [Aestuariirhabdus sp. Z084]|uniref:exodeoxyribonuclease VII small subunit n=1 Tax=Aestuariirhabdus haliotis TaxID=2918751 RepID=UPI00201B4125|nr:exodeoxyribonuclease VII small subunit [Aestuariirhabdus haliotis]MCL6415053.1 exodeoxyribonuclease VII small subunit [Aestuariirhabdus haliotis]MCL6418985.1 exodeoxyribonuclease VII small subunit [Aestuariirhabdus haliotis]